MNALFVDTGALVTRVLARDQYHHAGCRGWTTLEDVEVKLFSSEHMLDEAVSLLARQAGGGYASRRARDHLASDEIGWLNTSRDDWHEALRWLEKVADQSVSCTDSLSCALMRREGIGAVFGIEKKLKKLEQEKNLFTRIKDYVRVESPQEKRTDCARHSKGSIKEGRMRRRRMFRSSVRRR